MHLHTPTQCLYSTCTQTVIKILFLLSPPCIHAWAHTVWMYLDTHKCTDSLQQVFSQEVSIPSQAVILPASSWFTSPHTHKHTDSTIIYCISAFLSISNVVACHPAFPLCRWQELLPLLAVVELNAVTCTLWLHLFIYLSLHAACFKLGQKTRGKAMTCSCICQWILAVSMLLSRQTAWGQMLFIVLCKMSLICQIVHQNIKLEIFCL